MIPKLPPLVWLLPLLLLGIAQANSASAATVHYWRFENSPGFLADSVTGIPLTVTGTPAQTALPVSGPGSTFDDAITDTTSAVSVTSGSFVTASSFGHNDFTVEALANATLLGGTFGDTLVAMGDTQVNSEAAWLLQLRGAGGDVVMVFCNGNACELVSSGFSVTTGRDYYVAASVDLDGLTTTFYVQDLTAGGPLQSSIVAHTYTSLNAVAGFGIGALANGNAPFRGLLDEVRVSDHARPESELLVNQPDPSTPPPTLVPALGPLGWITLSLALVSGSTFVSTRRMRAA